MSKSVFLNQAIKGKNTWWRTILVVFSIVIGQVLGTVGFELYYIGSNPQLSPKEILEISSRSDISTFTEVLVIFLVTLLLFWACHAWLHKRSAKSTVFAGANFSWRLYFQGFLSYTLILFIVLLLTSQKELNTFVSNFSPEKFMPLALLGFVSFGIQSFTEEVLFRGYAFQLISRNKIPMIVAIIIQSVIFGLLHLPSGIANCLNATAIGITFSFITIWHNRIEYVSGAHNANNLMIALVIGGIGKELNKPFDPTINIPDMLISISSMIILLYFAYKQGNKGQLEKIID
jgi:membrane protease YdiL (CAAX protease family)